MALPLHAQVSGGRIPVFINTRGVESNAELQRIVRANIRTALGRFGRSVRSVFVWIDDTNGPRDGSGRRCRMEVALASGGAFCVSAEAPHEFAALAKCSLRARSVLCRRLNKRRRAPRYVKRRRDSHIDFPALTGPGNTILSED